MKKVRTRTAREKVMLMASKTSSRNAGMGTIMAVSIMTKAKITQASLYFTIYQNITLSWRKGPCMRSCLPNLS